MHIGIVLGRDPKKKWGGDLQVLNQIAEGIHASCDDVKLSIYPHCKDVYGADFLLLAGINMALQESKEFVNKHNLPFGVIPFYEDVSLHDEPLNGMMVHFRMALSKGINAVHWLADALEKSPDIVSHCYVEGVPRIACMDYFFLEKALVMIANSYEESKSFAKLYPKVPAEVVYWPILDSMPKEDEDVSFSKFINVQKKTYAIQVGRFEGRKNQLSTILAMKDIDIPLVFLSTKGAFRPYEKICIAVASILRKAPTYFIGNDYQTQSMGNLHFIGIEGDKLPYNLVLSALRESALHVSPSFYELPGMTYFEAAAQGVHSVIGALGAWKEYITYGGYSEEKAETFFTPITAHHVAALKKAIETSLNKKTEDVNSVPIFQRTKVQAAADFLNALRHKAEHCVA